MMILMNMNIDKYLNLNLSKLFWIIIISVFLMEIGVLSVVLVYRKRLMNAVISTIENENGRVRQFVNTCEKEYKKNTEVERLDEESATESKEKKEEIDFKDEEENLICSNEREKLDYSHDSLD